MKRVFSLLTAFVLVCALAVPAMAADYNYGDKLLPSIEETWKGSQVGKDIYPYASILYWGSDLKLIFTKELYASSSDGGYINYFGECILYGLNSSKTAWVRQDSFSNGTMMGIDDLVWTSNDVVNPVTNTVVFAHVPVDYPMCDGTSCPATDVNFDDVCDDCGLMLAYNLRVTPNSLEIVVKHSDTLTLLYRYTETLAGTVFDALYNDSRITVTFDNMVNHEQFKLVDGEWVDYASYPNQYGSHVISLSGDASIVSSGVDIYDANGDLFFRNPLWMKVEQVTQGGMANLTQTMGGTMTTLTLCGVGLMALLVVLKLFGKRLLIFRS